MSTQDEFPVSIEPSEARVRVALDGVTIADSSRAELLHETGLPTRYYLPREDVREGALEPSAKVTYCPYKGSTEYFSVHAGGRVHPDVAWSYPAPIAASARIAGLLCFPGEQVELYVDEVRQH